MLELFVYTVKIEGNDLAALALLPPGDVQRYGLPTEAILGDVPVRQKEMTVDGFTPNERFVLYLTNIVEMHAPELDEVRRQAAKVGNGPVYIIDYRNVNEGQKPPFEDVVGWFGARDGEIVADTYNANPNYQLLTNAGPPQLHPTLEAKLMDGLREIQRGEREEVYAPEAEDAWWNQ